MESEPDLFWGPPRFLPCLAFGQGLKMLPLFLSVQSLGKRCIVDPRNMCQYPSIAETWGNFFLEYLLVRLLNLNKNPVGRGSFRVTPPPNG